MSNKGVFISYYGNMGHTEIKSKEFIFELQFTKRLPDKLKHEGYICFVELINKVKYLIFIQIKKIDKIYSVFLGYINIESNKNVFKNIKSLIINANYFQSIEQQNDLKNKHSYNIKFQNIEEKIEEKLEDIRWMDIARLVKSQLVIDEKISLSLLKSIKYWNNLKLNNLFISNLPSSDVLKVIEILKLKYRNENIEIKIEKEEDLKKIFDANQNDYARLYTLFDKKLEKVSTRPIENYEDIDEDTILSLVPKRDEDAIFYMENFYSFFQNEALYASDLHKILIPLYQREWKNKDIKIFIERYIDSQNIHVLKGQEYEEVFYFLRNEFKNVSLQTKKKLAQSNFASFFLDTMLNVLIFYKNEQREHTLKYGWELHRIFGEDNVGEKLYEKNSNLIEQMINSLGGNKNG